MTLMEALSGIDRIPERIIRVEWTDTPTGMMPICSLHWIGTRRR